MNKKQRAEKIHKILNELYPSPAIPLQHRDPFTLLVAVILSAQCTDARVNIITPALFQRASTPEAMSQLSVEDIEQLIHSCGFSWTKARALQKTAQILCEKYAGEVPASFQKLEELPGVGHKTASVIMAQAFGKAAFPVDTHIHRCAKRWKLSSAKNVEQTERDLKRLFSKKDWIRLHLQIIYFAREYCPARFHEPKLCPICSWIE